MFQAIEGDEADGRVADLSSVSSRAHWLKPGAMLTLLQFGRATRHKEFAQVPTARELAPTDADRILIEMMEAPFALTRHYAAPPGTVDARARAKALQAAFLAVQKDPAYLEEAGRLKLDVSPIGPAEVLALLDRIGAAPEAPSVRPPFTPCQGRLRALEPPSSHTRTYASERH